MLNFVIFSIYVSIEPCMEMILKLRRKKTRVSSCRRTVLTLDDDKLLGEETLRMCEVLTRLAICHSYMDEFYVNVQNLIAEFVMITSIVSEI